MSFTTTNGTGTGELFIAVHTIDRIPVEDGEIDCKSPGSYSVQWDLNAVPDPDCNEPPCETWTPGIYNATLGWY